ncbi:hypothetical protein ANN_24364 [Periplaneta americana]|uniref:Uncharacterized protein n=1 Tax=Periplaneta americana TaxID=6978 RepID=A0ABQ8S3C8_PERAM|nr:hypothetical protein ANN_24364 [Periplaneta americana]
MSPGSNTEIYPAFAHIGSRENPGKNLNQVTCPDRESNPGHLVSRPDALTVTPQVWTREMTDKLEVVSDPGEENCVISGKRKHNEINYRRNVNKENKLKALERQFHWEVCSSPYDRRTMWRSSSLLSKNLNVRIYKTVILPVVLYGCETWTLTLREEQRLRVFENKVLRKIFGAKRDEVTGEWRKLHNTERHALYSSPDIIRNIKSRRLRWTGHVARMGESRNAYRVLVGRPEGKRSLGRPRRRWEDNIKMDLREVGYDDREWINLAQDRDQWWAYVREHGTDSSKKESMCHSEWATLQESIVHMYNELKEEDIEEGIMVTETAVITRIALGESRVVSDIGNFPSAHIALICLRKTPDRKRNEEILEQLEVESVEEKISRYKFNWLYHVRRMENSRIPNIMMQYKPRGHRRPGRPFRRPLDGAETGLQRPNS